MDIKQVIAQRRSVRSYKPDPVPKAILNEIMEQAQRTPSWANCQPWEFAIATGAKLEEIRKRFIEKEGNNITPDFQHIFEFPEPYGSRVHATIAKSHASVGIDRDNREQRKWWELQQLQNFGAPCEIYICIDRSLYLPNGKINVWPVFDCGAIVGSIGLLAANCHLGTIIQARAAVYPGIIREVLGIPDSKLILIGIAIGYPDEDNPVNQYITDREPLEKLVRWYGFV